MPWTPPEAWAAAHAASLPRWVRLAPAVAWKLTPPNDAVKLHVTRQVAEVMRRTGAAEMVAHVGLADAGGDVIARVRDQSTVVAACLFAKACLSAWRMPTRFPAAPLDCADPDDIRAAILGDEVIAGGLMVPFIGWLESCAVAGPEQEATASPLKALARGEEAMLMTAVSKTCWQVFGSVPMLWSSKPAGLDYRRALLAFEAAFDGPGDPSDVGAAFLAFQAIEAGKLEAANG